jgi:hypothetical protein
MAATIEGIHDRNKQQGIQDRIEAVKFLGWERNSKLFRAG